MNAQRPKPNMSAWERLNQPLNDKRSSAYSFSVRHMPPLLRKLQSLYTPSNLAWMGDITLDQAQVIKSYILCNYMSSQVDHAHNLVVRDYQQNNPQYNKPRMNMAKGTIENAEEVENALYGDSVDDDERWLETVKNHTVKVEEITESVQDNSQFVTKANHENDLRNVMSFVDGGITRLKTAIGNDISRQGNLISTLMNAVDANNASTDAALAGFVNRLVAVENSKPTIIELKRPDALETVKLGVQHRNFPTLLQMAHARENVWVYGPAGTGKSTAGEMLAVALFNDKAKFYTNGKMENQFEVLGYRNAAGVYQTTQFRQAYELGGIYMADEIDGSMPSAVLALNGALANGHCPFPDKTVARHPDFIFIGAANTTGMGGTIEYVGRMKHDAAFLDRFVTLDWPLDEGLEDALVTNKAWLAYVRATRAKLEKNPIKGHLITPRASIKGANLLRYGVNAASVIKSCLQKGLSDTQWNQIKPAQEYSAFAAQAVKDKYNG